MRSFMEKHPEIADAYSLYVLCRNQVPYEYEFMQSGKGRRMLLMYTTGLSVLPFEGGVMDQPERIMAYFESFLQGDEQGFYTRLQKKQ